MRVYYAALPAKYGAVLGLGRLCGGAIGSTSPSGPTIVANGAPSAGTGGGGPHMERFICSAMLCLSKLLSAGDRVGGTSDY